MNRIKVIEKEKKFLIKQIKKGRVWDRELIIYQWYEKNDGTTNSKLKIIFDLINLEQKVVRVTKKKIDSCIWDKEIEYLNADGINWEDYIGTNFVAKRRAISDKVFLDRFFKSNQICEYLLEVEDETDEENLKILGIEKGAEVSEQMEYQNANMCVAFTYEDYRELNVLLKLIPGWDV